MTDSQIYQILLGLGAFQKLLVPFLDLFCTRFMPGFGGVNISSVKAVEFEKKSNSHVCVGHHRGGVEECGRKMRGEGWIKEKRLCSCSLAGRVLHFVG